MLTLKAKHILRIGMVAGATCSAALLANAGEIPFQTPAQLKALCTSAGGDFGPPGRAGAYYCELKNGNVIACGGVGKHAKTCSNSGYRTGTASTTDGRRPVVRDHRRPRPGPVLGGATGPSPTGSPAPAVEPLPASATPGDSNGGGQQVVRDHRTKRAGPGWGIR
jgi:hypothetical protein